MIIGAEHVCHIRGVEERVSIFMSLHSHNNRILSHLKKLKVEMQGQGFEENGEGLK